LSNLSFLKLVNNEWGWNYAVRKLESPTQVTAGDRRE
jgi:hypothetical protein